MNEAEVDAGLAVTPGYRYAELAGGQLLVAGQVPQDSAGRIVGPDDPAAQAVACLENLRTLIGVHNHAIEDVRRLVIYVVGDRQNLTDAWSAVSSWFDGEVPPATLLGVNVLGHDGQLVEIDARIIQRDVA